MAIRHAPPATEASGPIVFARYAYPPNRLGLCGPDDAPGLIGSAVEGVERAARHLARGFEGAYPYLRLIAEENGIADPLDRRVVEAYWLGGPLADGVAADALHRNVDDRFRGRVDRRSWRRVEEAVRLGSVPIHAFHVLEVYPRVGLMRGGDGGELLAVLDACRVRWGRVVSASATELLVETRRLRLVDGQLRLAPPEPETARGWIDADGLLGGVGIGDVVSLHWGWACDRLTAAQVWSLASWTHRALRIADGRI